MASEPAVLSDDHGRRVRVGRTQEGSAFVSVTDRMTSVMAVFTGERLEAFTEAVDRLSVPGQRASVCPWEGCKADPATASGGLPPKWCAGECQSPATEAKPAAEGDEVPVRHVTLWLCDLCLDGAGGECHTPGCSLWMHRAPDTPVRGSQGVTVHGLAPIDVPGQPATEATGPATGEREPGVPEWKARALEDGETGKGGWE